MAVFFFKQLIRAILHLPEHKVKSTGEMTCGGPDRAKQNINSDLLLSVKNKLKEAALC